jgi:acyl-CoA synthetase (AMP-forming)/AMP-acid ligase II
MCSFRTVRHRPLFRRAVSHAFLPPPGLEVAVIDKQGRPLPPGEAGEIAVRVEPDRPVGLFHSYWKNPDATAGCYRGKLVDIEREVELGGAIHSKGVLILSSLLATRYAKDCPLSLAASLVFEQSYGMVDGDSASVAELCALLSTLADVPIRQGLAITGSLNQLGQAQPIGGVNEKIEGFFDVCSAVGLTADQGVLIPAANAKHLMLRADVIDDVAAGKFAVYTYETVDDAIELLTGISAGQRDPSGAYPPGTVNFLVDRRLRELAELQRSFADHSQRAEA